MYMNATAAYRLYEERHRKLNKELEMMRTEANDDLKRQAVELYSSNRIIQISEEFLEGVQKAHQETLDAEDRRIFSAQREILRFFSRKSV